MKKHILKFSFALAVVVAAGYTVYSSQTSLKMTGIALNNVEALASGEISNSCRAAKNKECTVYVVSPSGNYSVVYYEKEVYV